MKTGRLAHIIPQAHRLSILQSAADDFAARNQLSPHSASHEKQSPTHNSQTALKKINIGRLTASAWFINCPFTLTNFEDMCISGGMQGNWVAKILLRVIHLRRDCQRLNR
jgi:hypothetical protein